MTALWPYLILHPRVGLLRSLQSMSAYDWDGAVFYAGQHIHATHLPRTYPLVWLVIGSPLPTVMLAVLGLGLLAADLVRRHLPSPPVLLSAALLVVPIAVMIARHATLYDGLRHFLFTVPGMILLATAALVRLTRLAWVPRRRVLAAALVGLLLVGQVDVIVQAVRLRPLEYMYFSPVVGGFTKARQRYEADYWYSCQTLAVRWLAGHYRDYTGSATPTYTGLDVTVGLPNAFQPEDHDPDFVFQDDNHFVFAERLPAPPAGYRRVHELAVDRVTMCGVDVRQ